MIPRTVSSPLLGRGVTMAKAGVAGFAAAGDQAAVRRLAKIGPAKLVRPRTDSDHARARLPQQRRPARPLARPRTQTRSDRFPIIAGAVGALREAVVAASAVRGRRAIGASIRQSSGRVRKPHRPPRSSKHQYRRQRQPSVPAPRDHFVARSAAATNIRSTRRDDPQSVRDPGTCLHASAIENGTSAGRWRRSATDRRRRSLYRGTVQWADRRIQPLCARC